VIDIDFIMLLHSRLHIHEGSFQFLAHKVVIIDFEMKKQVALMKTETVNTINEPNVEPFIKKAEVARRLQKTVRTVDNLMKRGILPYYKIGRSVTFKWSEIASQLAQTCRVSFRSK